MATIHPQGIDPFVLSDTLPLNSTDTSKSNLDNHINAFAFEDFTDDVINDTKIVVTFVIFDYPNAANSSGTPPQVPIVEILTQAAGSPPAGFDSPGTQLGQTVGTGTAALTVPGGSVNYAYKSLGGGLYQITFTRDSIALNTLQWQIRFTINDGATSAAAQKGLTFATDVAGAGLSWIAVPGQGHLTSTGAPAIDFATALQTITLSGPGVPGSGKQLIAGKSVNLLLPVGNYGTAPLHVTAFVPASITNQFSLQLLGTLTVPPGSTDTTTLQATFAAPAAGQTGNASQATSFSLTCDDALAAPSGATAHINAIPLYATAGNFEFVFVLDLSGSMATNDAGGNTRWFQVQQAMGQIMTSNLPNFTGTGDTIGVVLYPNANGSSVGQVVVQKAPINQATTDTVTHALTAQPVDSTPMAGTVGSPGGIYAAAGLPSNPATDSGIFKGSADPAFARNFRWMVLMSDGMSNVGDDPRNIAPDYFPTRRIGVISVAYGKPGGGQVDVTTLKAVANASLGTNLPNPPNFFAADPGGSPSEQLLMGFEKTVANALGLQFAADPDAVLASGSKENRHKVIITEYDRGVSFLVCWTSPAAGELLQVQLLSPLGEQITSQNVGHFEMSYSATAVSRRFYASPAALLNHGTPRYGIWTIIVSRGATAAALPPLEYAYSVSTDSDLALSVSSARPAIRAGDPIEMVAALSVAGRPLEGAHVTAAIAGSGQGFDNWLASQFVTPLEYTEALRSLEGLHDVQALFVKATALAKKGLAFQDPGGSVGRSLQLDKKTGTYRTTFPATSQPGTYQFLVSATGTDDHGNIFMRQQMWQTVVSPQPDASSSLISITYQVVANQMQATLQIWPLDRFHNVLLVDPAFSRAIQVLVAGGAEASGPLRWNLNGSYTQVFTYPVTVTPTITIKAGGQNVIGTITPPDFSKLRFVDEVVRFIKGREGRPGANQHVDPSKALHDPSRKSPTDVVSLGGHGLVAFDIKGQVIHAREVTVFVLPEVNPRAYAVEVLPVQAGIGWLEVGQSRGVTQTFGLAPKLRKPPPLQDPYIEVEGRIADETFDVRIPLANQLHAPPDPLTRIGAKGIAQIRVRDLSNDVLAPDGTASPTPGVSVQGIGFSTS